MATRAFVESHQLDVKGLRERFAPVKGDPEETARRIADWSKYFFGDPEHRDHYHIRSAVPQFHIDAYRDLARDAKYFYISAPSEFGKTTVCSLIYPLYRICYYAEPYIVLSSRVY